MPVGKKMTKLVRLISIGLVVVVISLFLPAQRVNIEGIGTLSVGQEAAYASPDWLGTWAKRVQITIDQTDIDADLTHFPVLIHLSSACGKGSAYDMTPVFDEVGSNNKRIAVTKSDGTSQLYVEIEKWDAGAEEAWLWVSKSDWTISSTSDTVIYLYYDNTQPDNDAYVGDTGSTPAQNVWDANFKMVQHMPDGPPALAPVTYVAEGTGSGRAGNVTNVTPAYPTGLQANDLILLQVTVRNITSAPTTPTGFTLLFGPDATTLGRQWIYYKISDGTESGTITVTIPTTVCCIGRMYAFRNAATSGFTEGGGFGSGTDSSIEAQAVTTTGDQRLAVSFVFVNDDNAVDSFTGETGGDWTEAVAEFITFAGDDGCVQLQTAAMATAGTISGGSYTMLAADPWGVRAFAIIPAAGTQVTYVAAGTGSGAAGNVTNVTPEYPTGLQANDLILLQVTVRDTTSAPTTPTGFTLLFGPDATTLGRQWIYYKISDGTETGTITVTIPTSVCCIGRMYAFRNAATSDFTEGGGFGSGTDSSIEAQAVTTTGDQRLAVSFVFVNDDNAVDSFTGETGGDWTEAVDEFTTTAGADGCVQLQTATMATAGTISGGSYTMAAADPWGVRAFALIPSGTETTLVLDSTSNNNDGAKGAADEPTEVPGQIDGAQDYDGGDSIVVPHTSALDWANEDLTIEFWVRPDVHQDWDYFLGKGRDDEADVNYGVQQYNVSGRWNFCVTDSLGDWGSETAANSILTFGTWYRLAVTFEWSTKVVSYYNNKSPDGGFTQSITPDLSTYGLGIGCDGLPGMLLDGRIDEVRISYGIMRSAAWISASYESEIDDLLDFGSEETPVTIDITAPADIADWNLTPLETQPLDQTGTLTVTCTGSSWTVTATDEDTTNTNGQMTKYDGTSYDTGTKLATAMVVGADDGTNATGSEVTLPTGGTILTGTGAVTSEPYTIHFRQTVLWTDPIVVKTNGYPVYRIVVTFTGSAP